MSWWPGASEFLGPPALPCRPGLPLTREHLVGPERRHCDFSDADGGGAGVWEGVGREKMDESLMSPFPSQSWRQAWGTKGGPWESPLLPRMPGAERGSLWKEGL